MSETESVRISSDIKELVAKHASTIRPKTTIQAVIEHALEIYLVEHADEQMIAADPPGEPYAAKKKGKK